MDKIITKRYQGMLFLLIIFLAGCTTEPFYKEEFQFEDDSWDFNEPVIFKPEIQDTSTFFDIYVNIEHLKSYPFENLYIRFGYDYAGTNQVDTLNLDLINKEEGVYIGDCKDETCLIEGKVKSNISVTKPGSQKFTIEQFTREDVLEGIRQVGISIRKSN